MPAHEHTSDHQFGELKRLTGVAKNLISENRSHFNHPAPTDEEMHGLTSSIPTMRGKIDRTNQKIDSTLESNFTNLGILWPYHN